MLWTDCSFFLQEHILVIPYLGKQRSKLSQTAKHGSSSLHRWSLNNLWTYAWEREFWQYLRTGWETSQNMHCAPWSWCAKSPGDSDPYSSGMVTNILSVRLLFCGAVLSLSQQQLKGCFRIQLQSEISNLICIVARCFSTESSFLSSEENSWVELAPGTFFWAKDYLQLCYFDIESFSCERHFPATNSQVRPTHEECRTTFLPATSPNYFHLIILDGP